MDKQSLVRVIRICFWVGGAALTFAQGWAVRHLLFSDGLSYLQIAFAYLRGDWADAINPYWSPLYSWVLALAYAILRPPPYWQVATLHLVNLLALLASGFAFEFFMRELVRWKRTTQELTGITTFSDPVLYFAGYGLLLFEGLSQVHLGNTSPDMLAMALTILVSTLVWRVRTRGPSGMELLLIGLLCAALYLARTAFAPSIVVALLVIALSLRQQKRAWISPTLTAALVTALVSAPFVYAISKQVGHFTIGESGKLNYSWEVNSAPRFRHWQGEPKELGTPKHATTLAVSHPTTYTFAEPIGGTYPPWYNPAYWYDGIRPKLELRSQIKVWLVNLSVLCLVFGRSPIFVPVLVMIPLSGFALWWRRYSSLWPIVLLPLSTVGIYSLVYVERRYLAGNVLILWMTLLASLPLVRPRMRFWATRVIVAGCALFFAAFILLRQAGDVRTAASDLIHRHEGVRNLQYQLAERIRQLGIKPGDRVAYIGTSDMADWTRLDDVKIVGEVPVNHDRSRTLFNNVMIDKTDQVVAFWKSSRADQERVLDAFRNVGAKIVITDGENPDGLASSWPLVLPSYHTVDGREPAPMDPGRSRYQLLSSVGEPRHLTDTRHLDGLTK